jgi:hypothetical protein
MRTHRYNVRKLMLILFIAIALSGCGRTDSANSGESMQAAAPSVDKPSAVGSNTAAPEAGQPTTPPEAMEDHPIPTATPPASEPVKPTEQTTPPVQTASNKPESSKTDTESTGNRAQSLMNIRINDTRESVIKKHGQPQSESVWNEDDELLVYDYNHFTVGFSSNDKVEFVTVHSKEADTGLAGLRLGMKTKEAVESLGDPDTNTIYVWTYKSPNSIMKLDIDPKNDTIHSIKLFRK